MVQRSEVSSGKLEKLTRVGTRSIASAKRREPGRVYAGFAASISSMPTAPPCICSTSPATWSSRLAFGRAVEAAPLSASTADRRSAALVPDVAAPGPSATLRPAPNSRASSASTAASTPD